jgi:hypothetical protein
MNGWTKERWVCAMKEMNGVQKIKSYTMSFELWMSRMRLDMCLFPCVFLNDKWEPCYVTIGFLRQQRFMGVPWTLKVKEVLAKHGFNVWIIVCASIHNRGTKKECLIEKGLQKRTLDSCLSYIIIIVVDCCMEIDKMMSS